MTTAERPEFVTMVLNSDDLAAIFAKLEKIGRPESALPVLDAIAESIKNRTRVYPPTTIANSPSNPSGHWYQRGFGTKYASGASYETSQNLGDAWRHLVFTPLVGASTAYAEIWNKATYSRWVHGGDEEQRPYHKARGWKQLFDTAEKTMPELMQKLAKQYTEIWQEDVL